MNWRDALTRGTGLLAGAIAAGVLLLLGVIVVVVNERGYSEQKERELGVQAQIVSASVAPALIFLDNASAQQYLDALAANPLIAAAAVYDVSGVQVARYGRAGEAPAPAQATPRAARFEDGAIVVVTPVVQAGEILGTVYLRTDAETALQRFARYAGLGILVLLASLVLAVFGMGQAALKVANAELESRAAQLQGEIQNRERAEEELLQSRKMEAIGQLVGGVAHDFNNLLTVVLSGLRLMERHDDPKRRATTVEAMRQAAERGAGLTRQLLAFARKQSLKPEVIDVGARMSAMRPLLERSLRADIVVDIRVAPGTWRVRSDPTQLELAIINLAVNARDAMPKGGVLTITVENLLRETGECVAIIVRDTGIGMPDAVRRRVFEPYFTTKPAGQGTGLGLAQVYGIVTQSGGAVRVESVVNEGTWFTLFLPRTHDALVVAASPKSITGKSLLVGKSILIVEDDDGVAGVVEQLTRELGFKPTRAANAASALTLLNQGKRFDLVFSDILMPGDMDGLELAQEIEILFPNMPIILTTGYSGSAEVGDRFPLLRKPYPPEEFERLVTTIMSRTPALAQSG
ncbi:MAG TPA: ATP-binding protein [Verrucomicrobiae bacterium]|nr:ATP-binding protein [Verrucomicrobiae bacterium]